MGLKTTMRSERPGGVSAVLCGVCFCAVLCTAWRAWAAKGSGQTAGSSGRKVELTAWQQGGEGGGGDSAGVREEGGYKGGVGGFRGVYPRGSGDVHAPDSVSAVAELL